MNEYVIFILQEIGDEMNITEVMNPWLYQMGLPVVNITVVNNQIRATQMRFLNNPEDDPKKPKSPFEYGTKHWCYVTLECPVLCLMKN